MDFFDEVSKTVSRTANMAGKKAEQLANNAKIKFSLANLQSDLDELYENLGRIRYEAVVHGKNNPEKEADVIEKISSVKTDMEILKGELSRAKNEKSCPACGRHVGTGVSFCPYCGSKLK